MDQERLQYLLNQKGNGRLSGQEKQELDSWFHSLNYGQQEFEGWLSQAGGSSQLTELMYADFQGRLTRAEKKTPLRTYISWASAAAVLLLISGALLVGRLDTSRQPPATPRLASQIQPGGNKATLTLADGTVVALSEASRGEVLNQRGVSVDKAAPGELVYTAKSNYRDSLADKSVNTLSTPRGGRYQLTLADGTRVWLNAASSLRFPLRFDGAERVVSLIGEAYFEVAHNKSAPFKVRSANQEIQVLGTHFNVQAYPGDAALTSTLILGSVRVSNMDSKQSRVLKPGQQSLLSRTQPGIAVLAVNIEQAVAWKSGYFIFDNQDVKSVMENISRWYDVDVEYQTAHLDVRFGGTFSRASGLSRILSGLERLSSLHFEIKERRIIVTD